MIDLIIVGAGLTGLFAANLAAELGASVCLVARGRGGLSLSHGCIAVLDRAQPLRALDRLPATHPYKLVGKQSLKQSAKAFSRMMRAEALPYRGRLSHSLPLLQASGQSTWVNLAPPSLGQAHGPLVGIASIEGFRDFAPQMLAQALRAKEGYHVRVIQLPLPHPFRELYASDLAARFDVPQWCSETLRLWKPFVRGLDTLILPAILGLRRHLHVFHLIQEHFGCAVLEIPTLPPSLPGLRLERALRLRAKRLGVRFIEGSAAIGRAEVRSGKARVAGVQLQSAGGPRSLSSQAILLATGGTMHGGLAALHAGRMRESVFGYPIEVQPERSSWTAASPFSPQPYAMAGLCVNTCMHPLDPAGEPLFHNLYAAGGVIAGSDRVYQGSRQGIDLATAYRAMQSIMEDSHH